ncbi:MAG: hypothetical protein FWG65_06155 [Turicibacter sp.]|nr:hypothetical protein [Turicibacter sp.]
MRVGRLAMNRGAFMQERYEFMYGRPAWALLCGVMVGLPVGLAVAALYHVAFL